MVDDLAYDRESGRIYCAGSDFVDVFVQLDPKHNRLFAHIPAFRAKTAILVAELDRYYVAVLANLMQTATVARPHHLCHVTQEGIVSSRPPIQARAANLFSPADSHRLFERVLPNVY